MYISPYIYIYIFIEVIQGLHRGLGWRHAGVRKRGVGVQGYIGIIQGIYRELGFKAIWGPLACISLEDTTQGPSFGSVQDSNAKTKGTKAFACPSRGFI